MTIEITKMRVEDIPPSAGGGTTSELTLAIRALAVGEALSTPCIWTHSNRKCVGASLVHNVGHRDGTKYRTRCKDKVFYVGRLA